METEKKTSLILITGYLGSGKSTLIKNLQKNPVYKIAVIQNEFTNEMGIEQPLMLNTDGTPFDNFMEQTNGCMCCSAKDDLYKAIEYFLDGKQKKYDLDYIVIETNGLADPSNTIKSQWADDEQEFPAKIKCINSIISLDNFEKNVDTELFQKQIIYGDRIFLNKCDLLAEKSKEEFENRKNEILEKVKTKNPLATLVFTDYCDIDIQDFFEHTTLLEQNVQFLEKDIVHVHNHGTFNNKEVSFIILDYDENQEFVFHELEKNLGKLIWTNALGVEILRVKGIVKMKGETMAYSLQGVDETFELAESELLWEKFEKKPYSKFQFIGRNMDQNKLKEFQVSGSE